MKAFAQLLMATGLMVTATAASAHAGHDAGTGFTSGLLHPMLGLDHLLAMAAIGFWSVRQSATLKNSTPLFVIGGMVVGAGIAWGGLSLPGVETGISLSVILAGILIATLALTFAGRVLGTLMQKTDNRFGRALGGVVAATGALLAVA